MATTQRTVDEAQKYIVDSIEEWKKTDQGGKIISLSNWTEKWNSATRKPYIKMEEIQKNIRSLQLVIKRKRKMNPDTDTTALNKEIEVHKSVYAGLVEKYGEPKPKEKSNKEVGTTDITP